MTRIVAVFVIASALGILSPSSMRAQNPQAPVKFRSSTDAVFVEVSVRNGTKVVNGLDLKDFVVTDNGVPQDLSRASYGKLPIDVTVALDVSYSVTGAALARLRKAIVQMMSDLTPDDRLKLITFNMQMHRAVDFTGDSKAVESAINAVAAGGATSIFDALSVAFVSADHPDRRQLVVLFTDGEDSMSTTEPSQLVQVAQRSNATLTAVLPAALMGPTRGAIVTVRITPLQRQEGQFYQRLAADTGGLVIPITSPTEDLTATFRRALDEFRSSYVLYFTPTGVERGGFHTLTVTVPGSKGVTIRARKGYWGAGQ